MTQVSTTSGSQSLSSVLKSDKVQQRFQELLGEKTQGFLASVLQVCNNSKLLAKASSASVLNAAATAAVLDLPINNNLGEAWIVPYKGEAQFQIGWRGFVQLALRTGKYKAINSIVVYENQFTSYNYLTEELVADFSIEGEGKVVGYASYFRLHDGFEKTVFWTTDKVKSHAKKYSQTYGKKNKSGYLLTSPWNDEDQFDSMAKKTVLKSALKDWGPKSIEMEKAIKFDQSVQKEEGVPEYVDNIVDVEAINEDKHNVLQDLYMECESILPEKQKKRVEEIISNQEELSYDKTIEYLKSIKIEPKETQAKADRESKEG